MPSLDRPFCFVLMQNRDRGMLWQSSHVFAQLRDRRGSANRLLEQQLARTTGITSADAAPAMCAGWSKAFAQGPGPPRCGHVSEPGRGHRIQQRLPAIRRGQAMDVAGKGLGRGFNVVLQEDERDVHHGVLGQVEPLDGRIEGHAALPGQLEARDLRAAAVTSRGSSFRGIGE